MTVNEFRCPECRKLLCKYDFAGEQMEIEVRCQRCKQNRTLQLPHPITGSMVTPVLK